MYKVIFTQKLYDKINDFILSYRNIFLNIYDDTGIEDEILIRNNYVEISKKLKKEIINLIQNKLSNKIILGKRISDSGEFSIILQIGNFRLFIDYLEDNKLKERYIENIEFYKK